MLGPAALGALIGILVGMLCTSPLIILMANALFLALLGAVFFISSGSLADLAVDSFVASLLLQTFYLCGALLRFVVFAFPEEADTFEDRLPYVPPEGSQL